MQIYRKHDARNSVGAVLFLIMVFALIGFRMPAVAQDMVPVMVEGTYDQSGARSMLQMINAFRTNEGTQQADQAWWLDPDGSGQRIAINGLTDLVYDYELERIAMQRAAELAVSFSHTRPDGSRAINTPGVNGENIACGQTSVEEAFNDWLEADEALFEDQGHRVNMLGGYKKTVNSQTGETVVRQNFLKTIGIAHFVYDGFDFWVQEFGIAAIDPVQTDPCNEGKTVTVDVQPSGITGYELTVNSGITAQYHRTFDLSDADLTTTAVIPNGNLGITFTYPIETVYTWALPDEYSSAAILNAGGLYGNALGNGVLTVTNAQGNTGSVNFTVSKCDISDAAVTAVKTEFYALEYICWYSDVLPKAVVDGEELTFGTDCFLKVLDSDGNEIPQYGSGLSAHSFPDYAGTCTMQIYGTGNYTGTAADEIEITILPINDLQITAESGTELALVYKGTAVETNFSCPYYLYHTDMKIAVADPNVVDVVNGTESWDYASNKAIFPLSFIPKGFGNTTVNVYFPSKEGVNAVPSNTLSFTVSMTPGRMEDAVISGISETYGYTGEAVTPKPVVHFGDELLSEGADYTFRYEIGGVSTEQPVGSRMEETKVDIVIESCTARVTGSKTVSFTIMPVKLDVTLEQSYPYQAGGVHPVPVVSYKGVTLIENEDYTVSYGPNNEVGHNKGSVIVTGIGDYGVAGNQTILFDIERADIADAVVTAQNTTFKMLEYINFYSSILPAAALYGQELVFGTDFSLRVCNPDGSVAYEDVVATSGTGTYIWPETAGTYTICLKGKGNYTGEAAERITFTVEPNDDLQITPEADTQITFEYGGAACSTQFTCPYYPYNQHMTIEVRDESIVSVKTEPEWWDFDNKRGVYKLIFTPNEVGTTQVDVFFADREGWYSASNTITYTVTVSKCPYEDHVTASFVDPEATYVYQSPLDPWEPEVEARFDQSRIMEKGTDYLVSYEDNVYAGTAKAIITPADTDHYSGQVTLTFEIGVHPAQMILDEETVQIAYAQEKTIGFRGALSGNRPVLSVTGSCVTADLSFHNGTGTITLKGRSTGTATISITQEADNRYSSTSGEISVTVTEAAVPADSVSIGLSQESYIYDGSEKKPDVTVAIDGAVLDAFFYEVSWSGNTDPGTAGVSVTGRNGPVFTKNATFSIVLCDASALSDLIGQAEAAMQGVSISTDGSELLSTEVWVTQADKDALTDSIEDARGLLAAGKYTAAQVQAGSTALEEQIRIFNEAKKNGLIVKATGISLEQTQVTIEEGKTLQLTANVMPQDASDQAITWESADPSIAAVDDTGLVTAVRIGTTAITATTHDGGWSAECSVRVARDLSGFTARLAYESAEYTGAALTPAVTVTDGSTQLTAGQDYTVTYAGNINPGTATVTVSGKGSYFGEIRLTFTITGSGGQTPSDGGGQNNGSQPPAAGESQTPAAGGSQTPAAPVPAQPDVKPAQEVESAILGMGVDQDLPYSTYGKLQAKQKKVTAKAITLTWKKVPGAVKYVIYGGECGKGKPAQKLAEAGGSSFAQKKLKAGKYYKYIIVAVDAGNRTVAVSKMLHISTKGGKTGNVKKLSVTGAAGNRLTLKKGKSARLKVTATSYDSGTKSKKHRAVAFESSDTSVATVNAKGKVKAVGKGSCVIYVYAQNGVSAAVKVKVK